MRIALLLESLLFLCAACLFILLGISAPDQYISETGLHNYSRADRHGDKW